jgi:hypothetical protein
LEDKAAVLHVAIQKDFAGAWEHENASASPYSPQFYLIKNPERKQIIVVFRGTQSLHDIVVDLEFQEEVISLPSLTNENEVVDYRVHRGILEGAKRLMQPEGSALWGKLNNALIENHGYDLVLTGHSVSEQQT